MENTQILIRPIISEKSLNQAASGWYTFAVQKLSAKPQIKKAIEKAFGVKVLAVKTMIIKGKKVRVGRRQKQITRSSWKKAIVRLPQEQKIDLFETAGGTAASAPAIGRVAAAKGK